MTVDDKSRGLSAFAMFPLSTVLFPGEIMPLNVFEPRYRQLVADCQAGSGEFGIVLISRGSEVGGGDERFNVGTVAHIEHASPYSGGRWFLLVRGGRRISIRRWLADDPYPRAEVDELASGGWDQVRTTLDSVQTSVGRALALLAELGTPSAQKRFESTSTPIDLLWQLAALAPLNPLDAQKVLETHEAEDRAELLVALADSLYEDLKSLRGGSPLG